MNASRFDSRGRRVAWLMLAASMLALDQGVKFFVIATLDLGERIAFTPWFNLVHVLNPGAAFSFLADAGGWQRHFLSGLGLLVSLVLAVLLWRGVRCRLEAVAYAGLIGGALGNVVDRLRIGAVVDYLDLHWQGWHWPAFNLADVFVVGSAGLLVLASLRTRPSPGLRGQGGATDAPCSCRLGPTDDAQESLQRQAHQHELPVSQAPVRDLLRTCGRSGCLVKRAGTGHD